MREMPGRATVALLVMLGAAPVASLDTPPLAAQQPLALQVVGGSARQLGDRWRGHGLALAAAAEFPRREAVSYALEIGRSASGVASDTTPAMIPTHEIPETFTYSDGIALRTRTGHVWHVAGLVRARVSGGLVRPLGEVGLGITASQETTTTRVADSSGLRHPDLDRRQSLTGTQLSPQVGVGLELGRLHSPIVLVLLLRMQVGGVPESCDGDGGTCNTPVAFATITAGLRLQ
jgi:hypothetical protein